MTQKELQRALKKAQAEIAMLKESRAVCIEREQAMRGEANLLRAEIAQLLKHMKSLSQ